MHVSRHPFVSGCPAVILRFPPLSLRFSSFREAETQRSAGTARDAMNNPVMFSVQAIVLIGVRQRFAREENVSREAGQPMEANMEHHSSCVPAEKEEVALFNDLGSFEGFSFCDQQAIDRDLSAEDVEDLVAPGPCQCSLAFAPSSTRARVKVTKSPCCGDNRRKNGS